MHDDLTEAQAAAYDFSLCLVEVGDLVIVCADEGYGEVKLRTRASFSYAGIRYKLAITDPAHFDSEPGLQARSGGDHAREARMGKIATIGHSTHRIEHFLNLLQHNGVTAVADVRSSPFSRHHPHFNQEALKATLKHAGLAYVFLGKDWARVRTIRVTMTMGA